MLQEELAARTIKEIKRRAQDNNNYSFSSNAVAFANKNPNLYIGQKVTFDDGFGYQLKTRVIKLVYKAGLSDYSGDNRWQSSRQGYYLTAVKGGCK